MSTLQEIIDAGRPGDTVTVEPGVYDTESTVVGPPGVAVVANGVTLRSRDSLLGSLTLSPSAVRVRSHYRVGSGGSIVGLTVDGPAPEGAPRYDARMEAQHGIHVFGDVQDAVVSGCVVRNVYGDGVYVGEGKVDKTGHGPTPDRITIEGVTISNVGRQGFAVAAGEDIVFRDSVIVGTGRSSIDLEPNAKAKGSRRILIERVDLRRKAAYSIASAGQGFLDDVTIRSVTADTFTAIWSNNVDRFRWLIDGVDADESDTGGDRAIMRFGHIFDVTVMNFRFGRQRRRVRPRRDGVLVDLPDEQYLIRAYRSVGRVNVEGVDWADGWGAIHPLSTAGRAAHCRFSGRPSWIEVTAERPVGPSLVGPIEPVALPALPVNA